MRQVHYSEVIADFKANAAAKAKRSATDAGKTSMSIESFSDWARGMSCKRLVFSAMGRYPIARQRVPDNYEPTNHPFPR